jgi:hypothetical protein
MDTIKLGEGRDGKSNIRWWVEMDTVTLGGVRDQTQ